MYCNVCGTNNVADSKYCRECGTKIETLVLQSVSLSAEELTGVVDPVNRERLAKLLDMAFWHNQAGNMDAAVLACNAALSINPDSTTAHSLLGTIYERKGNDEQAIAHFEAVLALNPDSHADAAKLEQLRNGIHARAVAPPPITRWLPPALAGLSILGVREKMESAAVEGLEPVPTRVLSPERTHIKPIVAAAAATVLVLIVGIASIHPASQPRVTVTNISAVPTPQTVPGAAPIRSSLLQGLDPRQAPVAQASVATPPVVLLPKPLVRSAGNGPDPFTGHTSTKIHATPPTLALPRQGHMTASAGRIGRDPGVLPPLTGLQAVSPSNGAETVMPAPVSVAPTATVASVPQHVVVVSQLGNTPNTIAPAVDQTQSSPVPEGPSRIHITVDKVREGTELATPVASPAVSITESDSSDAADQYQQSALSQQQDGKYSRAMASYQKAIRLYKSQIAAGRNTEAAQRGLHACQTGLEICQQSQP